jgi:hypothetical protein
MVIELLACVAQDSAEEEQILDTSDPGPAEVLLTDANNYYIGATLDIPSFPVTSLSDIRMDWSQISSDLQCHDVDPVADIDVASALIFPYLSEEEVEIGLGAGTVQQVDLGGYVLEDVGDATDAQLADLGFYGTDVDIELLFKQGSGSWLVLLTTGDTLGVGGRTMAFLEPRDDATTTEVSFPEGCGLLAIEPDLHSLTPPVVRRDGPWNMDWSGLLHDGQGLDLVRSDIDTATLGWYPGYTTADLEADFFDVELNAELSWAVHLTGGQTIELQYLVDADLQPFPGFGVGEGEGVWLFALRCSLCPNPAPVFLTVLDPP